jgi:hypothetical protein
LQISIMSEVCHSSGVGRRAVGVILGLFGAVFAVFLILELVSRPTLAVSQFHDTPGMLLAADIGAAAAAVVACVLLLLPECCCESRLKDSPSVREDFRRERNTAALLLVVGALVVATTARIRDVNFKPTSNEHQVCGRQKAPNACPTRRVLLSDDYQNYLLAHEPTCWLNTSSTSAETFTWGQALSTATNFPTNDFADKATYEDLTQYAECFYFGCSEECTPDSHSHNSRMLHFETAFSVGFVALVAATMCVGLPTVQYYDVAVAVQVRERTV